MARSENRASRDYNRGMEDMRKRMEAEMQEMEKKLRAAAKRMVLKERELWREDRQYMLNEGRTILKKLSVTEEENRKLKSDLYQVREDAAKEIKKRDEQIISLQQSLRAQKEETEGKRAPLDGCQSSRLKSMKESWQKKVSQLEELLTDKDKEISRANEKRRARTNAHIDTLALLSKTQSALEQTKLTCDNLEEKLQKLAERQENYQKEVSKREESFRKELSETVKKSRKDLAVLCDSLQIRSQQLEEEKRELEETLRAKEEIWIHEEAQRKEEIQRLTEENLQLQELMKKKKSFWSWSRNK